MSFTLAQPVHSELVIKKSRFIGCVQPVADRAAALAVVASLRAQHPAAAHVCWALMAGGQSAANDDGEPGGTAGRPMLEVLRHQELEGVLAVPTGIVSAEMVRYGREGLPEAPPRQCTGCGADAHASDAQFCRHCGHPLG